jgi:N-acetylglucosamine-6-phosphate deacetylase
MDHAISNVMRMTGISLVEAISMATRNPARVGRIAGRQRGIATGERADLVLFRYDAQTKSIEVVQTIVGGQSVYSVEH